MFKLLSFILFFCYFQDVENLIVPDEVPSLLSLIYSNIPPIRKGTDSRIGWGFRLGDHADFQVLVELGPQKETKPLSNEGDKNNKRNALNNLRNTLYAQNQLIKQQQQQQQQKQISNTDGGKWIQSWSSMMNPGPSATGVIEGAGEIDASLVIPSELEELYGPATKRPIKQDTSTPKIEVTSTKIKTTTDPKDALDNVDFD